MTRHRSTFVVALLAWVVVIIGCSRNENRTAPIPAHNIDQTPVDTPDKHDGEAVMDLSNVNGEPLGKGLFVGSPKEYDNLTVFPILAKTQTDVGPLTSLHDALEKGSAEVRELDSAADDDVQQQQPQAPQVQQPAQVQVQVQGASAQVGTLAIQNKGDVPVYVLAGTIVKGGKQDRQVGQDFIIGAKETVPIDAFCVEHGRWNGTRDGKATGGKFEAVKQLANRDVRVAGQYKGDQGEVWSKVSKVNAANKKQSDSDSLLATLDDAEIKKRRDELGKKIMADLDGVRPAAAVVGYAYAVNGKVMGVRWFAHHKVFRMFREVLLNTAIVDAITASATDENAEVVEVSSKKVASFVADARKAPPAETKKTQADNVNEYGESEYSFSATTVVEEKEKRPGKSKKKRVDMSVDITAK